MWWFFQKKFELVPFLISILQASLFFIAVIIILYFLSNFLERKIKRVLSSHAALLIKKLLFYGGSVALLMFILGRFGIKANTIVATAGVMGVAVGFAAQTSIANIISGLFLLAERSFAVDDIIEFDGMQGRIESIDFLSVKLRTEDNTLVRVPNELLIKHQMANVTHYPFRNLNCTLFVENVADIKHVVTYIRLFLANHDLAYPKIAPRIVIDENYDNGWAIKLRIPIKQECYAQAKEELLHGLLVHLKERNVSIQHSYLGFKRPQTPTIMIEHKSKA